MLILFTPLFSYFLRYLSLFLPIFICFFFFQFQLLISVRRVGRFRGPRRPGRISRRTGSPSPERCVPAQKQRRRAGRGLLLVPGAAGGATGGGLGVGLAAGAASGTTGGRDGGVGGFAPAGQMMQCHNVVLLNVCVGCGGRAVPGLWVQYSGPGAARQVRTFL